MSLSTRCPSCGTTFKIVPDQLKVSEGWVRCGHCQEVFDASAHLRPLEETAPAVSAQTPVFAPHPEPAPEPLPEPEPQPEPEPEPEPVDPLFSVFEPEAYDQKSAEAPAVWMRRSPAARVVLNGETLPPPRPAGAEVEPLGASGDSDHAEDFGDIEVPSALLLQMADNDEPQQSLYQTAFVPPVPDAGTPEAEAQAEAGDAAATLREFDFVRVAERRAFWQRPVMVLASLAVCLVLALALLLQVVRVERDRLAAYLPGLAPVLASVCVPLGCEVRPLQRIDSMVIDSSAFNKVSGDLFQFDVEVRNTGTTPLAMPALELTLTDAQDLPLLRRVLLPKDVQAKVELAGGSAWSGSMAVQLQAPVSGDRVSGYRVLAFYP